MVFPDILFVGILEIFLSSGDAGMPHDLLEGPQITAVHQPGFGKAVTDSVRSQLRLDYTGIFHVFAHYPVNTVSSQWPPFTLEKVAVVAILRGKSQEESSGVFANGYVSPAGLAQDLHFLGEDMLSFDSGELSGAHPGVLNESQQCLVPQD